MKLNSSIATTPEHQNELFFYFNYDTKDLSLEDLKISKLFKEYANMSYSVEIIN